MPGRPKKSAIPAMPAAPVPSGAGGGYTLGSRLGNGLFDVTLPSGATCQARRPGIQGLIAAGLLDSFDSLTALVQEEIIAPKTPKGQIAAAKKATAASIKSAAEKLNVDKEKLADALHLIDRLAAGVITQPVVWVDYQMKDEPDEVWLERKAEAEKVGALAVRIIDLDDKMFLMNWAIGGTEDLAQFRSSTNILMGNLAAG